MSLLKDIIKTKRDNFRVEIRKKQQEEIFFLQRKKMLRDYKIEEEKEIPKEQIFQSILNCLEAFENENCENLLIILKKQLISLRQACNQLVLKSKKDKLDDYRDLTDLAEILIERDQLGFIIKLIDISVSLEILKETLWIILDLTLTNQGLCSRMVFDANLAERVFQVFDHFENHQIKELSMNILRNLIADEDRAIFEYISEKLIETILSYDRSNQEINEECAGCLQQITVHLVRQENNELYLFTYSIQHNYFVALGQYLPEKCVLESIVLLFEGLDDNSQNLDFNHQNRIGEIILKKGYGIIGKVINFLKKCLVIQELLQTRQFIFALKIISFLSGCSQEVQDTLVCLRILEVLSQILVLIKQSIVKITICEIVGNLCNNQQFINDINPSSFMVKEFFQLIQSPYLGVKISALISLCHYVTYCNDIKSITIVDMGLVHNIYETIEDMTSDDREIALETLIKIIDILQKEIKNKLTVEDKYLNIELDISQGKPVLERLTQTENESINELAQFLIMRIENLDLV